jgi:hypothetical protein
MLAGDEFTNHPPSVCPVIGSFLRAYNDRVDDERRQDLYRYASAVAGSRASGEVQQARADRLAEWAETSRCRGVRRRLPSACRLIGIERRPPVELRGAYAVRAIGRITDQAHSAAPALIDELSPSAATSTPSLRPPSAATTRQLRRCSASEHGRGLKQHNHRRFA